MKVLYGWLMQWQWKTHAPLWNRNMSIGEVLSMQSFHWQIAFNPHLTHWVRFVNASVCVWVNVKEGIWVTQRVSSCDDASKEESEKKYTSAWSRVSVGGGGKGDSSDASLHTHKQQVAWGMCCKHYSLSKSIIDRWCLWVLQKAKVLGFMFNLWNVWNNDT